MERGESHLQQAQRDVEEVKVLMKHNLDKVEEREGKLSDLDTRAEELRDMGKEFEKKTVQVKKKMWWENKRMKIILISVGVVVAVAILGIIIFVCT